MLRTIRRAVVASVVVAFVSVGVVAQQVQEMAIPDGPKSKTKTRNVAIVVHEGVELLDFAGPGEVFAAASRRGSVGGVPWFNVYTVAPAEGPITSQGFVKITPEYTIKNCPQPDILVIPGGDTGKLTEDAAFMSWVRDTASQREITFSVCTGAFVLSETGLLDGKEATTHWGSVEALKREATKATVHSDKRFLDNGNVITTAGVSAGIDGALHVVARLLGRETAAQTARYMEYQWTPDARYASKYSEFNPQLDEKGQAFQKALTLRNQQKWPEAIAAYEALTVKYPADADAWYYLGYVVHASGDIDKAIVIHQKAASLNFRRDRPLYNLACAYALKGQKDLAIKTLSEAIDAGFDNREYAQNDHDFDSVRDDPKFKALLERMD